MTSHVEEKAPRAIGQERSLRNSLARLGRMYGMQIGIFVVFLVIWAIFLIGAAAV